MASTTDSDNDPKDQNPNGTTHSEPTKPITIMLPDDILKKLKVVAIVRETSVSELKRCMRDFRQVPSESTLYNSFMKPLIKTTTIRSEDYDWAFGLRQQCLYSAYNDNPGALLTNTAIFMKCPMLPTTLVGCATILSALHET